MMLLTFANTHHCLLKLGAITLLSLLSLTGCQKEPEIPQTNNNPSPSNTSNIPQQDTGKYHIYVVLAPINKENVTTAYNFLQNSTVEDEETSLFVQGHTYTIAMLCQEDGTVSFYTNNQSVNENTETDALLDGVKNKIIAINKEKESCNSKPNSLIKIATNLQDAAENKPDKLIIFLQVPWTKEEFAQFNQSSSEQKSLNEIMQPTVNHIAETNKVERLILFGLDPDYTEQVAINFQALNSILDKSTNSLQDEEFLKNIHLKIAN